MRTLALPALRGSVLRPCQRHNHIERYPFRRLQHDSAQPSHVPKLAQSSFWHSIVPKPLRDRLKRRSEAGGKAKKTNPASYFIWIYLFIGSQSIRIMGVQQDFNTFMRKADLKLNRLREVVEKLQKGEPVDVEKVLGTGDEIQEREWEDALRELEEEDRIWQSNKKKSREKSERLAREKQDANPINDSIDKTQGQQTVPTELPPRTPGFY
ncbi:hypothetical protein B0A52_01802 [Exophiala mesophila]|uniref:Uncharacterized protein n=1 Tax=Exophiala mesophila TaxID=212818 RepID=A0A438NG33_EXOME|nr:hypothetical protein B0A52_01802 [Exophiala mesophila]